MVLVLAVVALQWRHVGRFWVSQGSMLSDATLAPPLEVTDADGRAIPMTELRDQRLIVTFWAAWCAPCRKEIPELAAVVGPWNEVAPSAERAVLLAINEGDDVDSVSMFLSDPRLRAVRFAFDKNGATGDRWGVTALPTTVLVAEGGRIHRIQVGYDRTLAEGVRRFLRGEAESGDGR